MDKKLPKEKTYSLTLTEEQIAIIKAGLQYYWLAEDFGYGMWGTMPLACFGSSDNYYFHKVRDLTIELNNLTKIKPNYGWWGDIKTISRLCKAEYKKAKKQGKEDEIRMNEIYLSIEMEILLKASERTGNWEWQKMIDEQRELNSK